jgi:predicted aspartyl protease
MKVSFRYEYLGRTSFGPIFRPIAKVSLHALSVDKAVDIWMIVDTGADYTIVPRHIAEKLRISLEKDCTKDTTFGVGGDQSIYFLKKPLRAKLGEIEREIPLAFFDNNEVPALLGRLGFLETLDVEFLKNKEVVFKA